MTILRIIVFALWTQLGVAAAQTPATVRGMIRAASGQPVGSATVELKRIDGTPPQSYSTTTAGDGTFLVPNVRPGEYRVAASAAGYLRTEYGQRRAGDPGVVLSLSPGQNAEDVQIPMAMPGVITGRVVDSDGDPLGGAQVRALSRTYKDGQRILKVVKSVNTNDLGEYRLFGLVPGAYFLSVDAFSNNSPLRILPTGDLVIKNDFVTIYYPGSADPRAATSLDVSAGSTSGGVDFTILPMKSHHVRGNVPGGGANVTLAPLDPVAGASSSLRKTNAITGPFDFDEVAPGPYLVIARTGDLSGSVRIEVRDSDVDGVNVSIGTGFVIPVHASFDSHAPLEDDPDFEKIYFQLTPDPAIAGINGDMYTPFPNGGFGFEVMSGEGYRISLSRGLPNTYIKSARMGARDVLNEGLQYNGEPDAKIEIVIGTEPGMLTGAVVDGAKHPSINTTVVLVPDGAARRRAEAFRVTTTDTAGRFQIPLVPPGSYSIFAWESVETGAWQDPDFLKEFEARGTRIQITDGARESVTASVIAAQ